MPSTSMYTTLLATSQLWFTNYTSPNNTFPNGRTLNATHTILPSSLGVPPRQSNSEMNSWLGTYLPGLHNYSTIYAGDMPTIIDPEQRRIVLHLRGTGNSDIGPYENEYLWVLHANEAGNLIQESFEYIDSYTTLRYWEGGRSILGWSPGSLV